MKLLYAKLPEYIHAVIAYDDNGAPSIVVNERVPASLREYAVQVQLDFLNTEIQLLRCNRHDFTAES